MQVPGHEGRHEPKEHDMPRKNSPKSTAPAITVAKYGGEYPAEVVRSTKTRHLVRFTQKSGKTVERWVAHSEVQGYVAPVVAEVAKSTTKAGKPTAAKAAKRAPKPAGELVAVKAIAPSAAGRLGDAVGSDFIVRWPKGGADLLQRVAGEGDAWLVRCNAHGTTTPAANVKAADLAGRKAQRVTWCAECAAAAK